MSHVTSLLVGLLFSATVLVKALLFPGYAILNGNLFYDVSNGNVNPSEYVMSGAIKTYPTQTGGVPGSGIRLTASGARNFVASWQVPTSYSSGALLESARLECGNVPFGLSGSLVIAQPNLNAALTTGTAVRHFVRLSTGSTVTINTGALLNTKIPALQYVSFITSSGATAIGAGSKPDCVLKLQVHEKYSR